MQSLFHDLKIAYQWSKSVVDLALKKRGLDVSVPQATILIALLQSNEVPSQKVLSDQSSIDVTTLNGIVKKLVQRGYINRGSPDTENKPSSFPHAGFPFGRDIPVTLTFLGRSTAKIAVEAFADADAVIRERTGFFAEGLEDGLGELASIVREERNVSKIK